MKCHNRDVTFYHFIYLSLCRHGTVFNPPNSKSHQRDKIPLILKRLALIHHLSKPNADKTGLNVRFSDFGQQKGAHSRQKCDRSKKHEQMFWIQRVNWCNLLLTTGFSPAGTRVADGGSESIFSNRLWLLFSVMSHHTCSYKWRK